MLRAGQAQLLFNDAKAGLSLGYTHLMSPHRLPSAFEEWVGKVHYPMVGYGVFAPFSRLLLCGKAPPRR